MRTFGGWWLAALALASGASAAEPDPAAGGAGGAPVEAGAPGGGAAPERTKAPERLLDVELHGRLFAGATADERTRYQRNLAITSARLQIQASVPHVEMVFSADPASSSLVKDAYARLADASRRYRLYAGQFKAPFSERELTSAWAIPLVRRGVVNEVLVKSIGFGGRELGLMGEAKLGHRFEAELGVFQKAGADGGAQDLAARVSVRPLEWLVLGASAFAPEALGDARHLVADGHLGLRLGPARADLEGYAGRVPLGPMLAATALVAVAVPTPLEGWTVEPVAGVEQLQIQGPLGGQVQSAVLGVDLRARDGIQLRLQGERAIRAGDERPRNMFDVQIATRF